jgi:hypothetical protein
MEGKEYSQNIAAICFSFPSFCYVLLNDAATEFLHKNLLAALLRTANSRLHESQTERR